MDIASIQKRIASIEKFKDEIKVAQEAIKNALQNDAIYKETVDEAKQVNTKKKKIRDEILNQAENRDYAEKIKETREEISTLEELLSYELVEYSQKNNTDMIQGDDGLVRKFKIIVRLMPSRGFDGERTNDYLG